VSARKVALVVGGLSRNAVSGRVAEALRALQLPGLALERVEIGSLPLYNPDLETENPPPAWSDFRARIRASEAVLFVTPEYNRGPPGAMKNAVDVGSRPWGKSVWDKKPCGIVSTSPGPLGGYSANHQLRQNLSYFAMPTLLQAEMYLVQADKLVANGQAADDKAREMFTTYLNAFAGWIERNLRA
jgi:chromate reductase